MILGQFFDSDIKRSTEVSRVVANECMTFCVPCSSQVCAPNLDLQCHQEYENLIWVSLDMLSSENPCDDRDPRRDTATVFVFEFTNHFSTSFQVLKFRSILF